MTTAEQMTITMLSAYHWGFWQSSDTFWNSQWSPCSNSTVPSHQKLH